MELEDLMKEWRVWVLAASLFFSLVMLGPHYVGEAGKDAGDVTIEAGQFLNIQDASISAQGGDAGQSAQGGDGGTIELRYNLIHTEGFSTSLSGGAGGRAGILGSAGEDGESGSLVRKSPDYSFSSVVIPAGVSAGESFRVETNISNRGSFDGSDSLYYLSGSSLVGSKNIEVAAVSSQVYSMENRGISSEGLQKQVFGIGSLEKVERKLRVGEEYFEVSITGYSAANGTVSLNSTVENLGSMSGSQQLSFSVNGKEIETAEISLEAGEKLKRSFSTGYTSERGYLNLSVSTENSTDSAIKALPNSSYFRVEIEGSELAGLDEETLEVNASVENLGDTEDTQNISLELGGNTSVKELELEAGKKKFIEFDSKTNSTGYIQARLTSENDSDSERLIVGKKGTAEIRISDVNATGRNVRVKATLENPGDVPTDARVFFRTGQGIDDYRQIELAAGESRKVRFKHRLQDRSGIKAIEVWTGGSYDADTVSFMQDGKTVTGEVCGSLGTGNSSYQRIVVEGEVEVCEEGVSIVANDSVLVRQDAVIDASEKNSGRGASVSIRAEKVDFRGKITTDGYSGRGGDVGFGTKINKGLDLKGGTRVLLGVKGENTSKAQVEQIGNILQQRVSAFGLTQANVRTVNLGDAGYRIQMSVATTNKTQLRDLISQEGKFEARLPFTVRESLSFDLGEKSFEFTYDGAVSVNGTEYTEGARFTLAGTKFRYVNNTGKAARLEVVLYDGSDIEGVLTSRSRVSPSGGSYSFSFPIVLKQSAAEKVRTIAQNFDDTYTDPRTGSPYLGAIGGTGPAMLTLYVDGERQSSLRMGAIFRTQVVTQPSINGGGSTEAAARADMRELQAILQSGSLPAPVEIQSISTISSSLGSEFMSAAIISIVLSLVAVGGLVFLRYRDPRYVVPIVITGASEVFILLGTFFSTIITLDLASIAGIIAAVGTGVDDQIIITDESGREVIRDWTKRLKRAFFVIFTSAASTIGAMMPVVSPSISNLAIGAAGAGIIAYTFYGNRMRPHYVAIGALAIAVSAITFTLNPSGFALQSIRGFAITTILGVLVGITVTRPAYAKMLEYLDQ